jgi:hypothetical protein
LTYDASPFSSVAVPSHWANTVVFHGQPFTPDVVDRNMESGQDAAEALKPAAQVLFVVALTTKRVGAGNAVLDMRRDRLHRFIPAMAVDVVEGLSDFFLDNVTVEHWLLQRRSRKD